jgi:hypothetical protein
MNTRFLWDHTQVTYERVAIFSENCWAVSYGGTLEGYVSKRATGYWGYRTIERDQEGMMLERPWTVPCATRRDAADHLISANRPSASWIT